MFFWKTLAIGYLISNLSQESVEPECNASQAETWNFEKLIFWHYCKCSKKILLRYSHIISIITSLNHKKMVATYGSTVRRATEIVLLGVVANAKLFSLWFPQTLQLRTDKNNFKNSIHLMQHFIIFSVDLRLPIFTTYPDPFHFPSAKAKVLWQKKKRKKKIREKERH